jgi:hypothetical protein
MGHISMKRAEKQRQEEVAGGSKKEPLPTVARDYAGAALL